MDLATRLAELQKRTVEHREVLLTEEAAKTALVMPFIQALGYDVFNPSEVVPEYTADVGTKKGEKVDYAICSGGKVTILIECKPSTAELNINHASQLFRYFSVTDDVATGLHIMRVRDGNYPDLFGMISLLATRKLDPERFGDRLGVVGAVDSRLFRFGNRVKQLWAKWRHCGSATKT